MNSAWPALNLGLGEAIHQRLHVSVVLFIGDPGTRGTDASTVRHSESDGYGVGFVAGMPLTDSRS